eukprot:TRINITY_DN65552_c0_g1_i1.p1 TRINITY_DN65552_c0_g1~~TRINITY_DN65552_c0_g1_i1.p1  ORF type:complete len:117 (-),score=34.49 TRINITY_DN65552_c0_g1_i1:267-617(-)
MYSLLFTRMILVFILPFIFFFFFFFQAEDGIRDAQESRGLGDVYKRQIEDCIAANECFLERKNYTLCKMNSINPRYRLRGNPYDVATEDQKRLEARNERIANRELEQAGYVPEKKE